MKLAITVNGKYPNPTQYFYTIEQIIQTKFQSADSIINTGAGYIVENMAMLFIEMSFRIHCYVHVLYK